ncbi:deoxyribose-phosphate aldolase [Ructibacterium gallinarum]|uniref:Deoxyribose-phosphate aldolase n=1 Tax=Ructibacterium gallinarum TaxID=2779355 RepID=A0A9D5R9N5_9FIRM|nr:deoxyribose-phosphate aldolase [Ructibacterium gallinarum]MBE5040689.1 deoxyribose-phosphate aldolase [Ructibacterium gallinarum]
MKENFNKIFDHTILKPSATSEDLKKVCDDAVKYGFCSVAVNTGMVSKCAKYLSGTGVPVDAAVGFPLGITTVELKSEETREAIKNGAGEIDYVVNIGKVKEGDFAYIEHEMKSIVEICRNAGKTVKVIFENCYLNNDEKIRLCEIAKKVKPDFIKTSTGFGPSSATIDDVRLMKKYVGDDVKVKAAGGIRNLETCLAMIEAGAERIGCSNSCEIADEYRK